jgi:two-component system cell cycle sensor histidine kinase/response regulator CckA
MTHEPSADRAGSPPESGRAPEDRVRAQFRAIPVPTYAWQEIDGRFILVDYNDAALEITKGHIADLVGKTVHDLYGPDSGIVADIEHCLRERTPIRREMDYTFMTTGARRRLAITYVAAATDVVLAYTEDVTERRHLEEQLRQAQKMEAVGLLAGGVAHDFNNLLTVIQAYCDALDESLEGGSALAADVAEIRGAASRAASLTRQLLAFSRKQVLQPRSLDLGVIIARLEPMLRRTIGEDIRVEVRTEGPIGRVQADPGQIEQVVLNLALTARDSMPAGGTLTLETANVDVDERFAADDLAPGRHVRLRVRDTGHGMDEATRLRIFEPFFTTKEHGRGSGLGLSTVYGIVKQSGGTVRVDSEPGKGSCFEIFLPHDPKGSIAPRPNTVGVSAERQGVETILLAEDEDALRVITRRVLERKGFRVLVASDGRDALRVAAAAGPIDLLVTDVVMPELGGRELFTELRALRPGLRVLYMSGYTDDEMLRRGMSAAGTAFLQKPFATDALLTLIREVIDAPEEV